MRHQRLKIYNAKVITPTCVFVQGCVLIEGEKIVDVRERNIDIDATEIDAEGKYVAPGFIDIHVHGGGGHDFMDGTETAFLKIAETHARYGTTAMLPTTLTSSKEELIHILEVYESVKNENINGAQFLGMHLEGPYIAMSQKGAQDERYIRDPLPEEYEETVERFNSIKRWSAAPELKGAIAFGRYITSKGILAAIAHTDAIYEEALEAFENGYTLATHFYSAMSGVTPEYTGVTNHCKRNFS